MVDASMSAVRVLSTNSRFPTLPKHVLVSVCRCLDGPLERFYLTSLLRLQALQLVALYDLDPGKAFDFASDLADVKSLNCAFAVGAPRNGHVEVLQWWRDCKLLDNFDALCSSYVDRRPMDIASENGHIAVLQWWKDHCGDNISPFGNPHSAMVRAASAGHVEVLQWWKASGLELRDRQYHHSLPRSQRRFQFNYKLVFYPINLDNPSARGYCLGLAVGERKRAYLTRIPTSPSTTPAKPATWSCSGWWKTSGLDFKHTTDAIDEATAIGLLTVLDWWLRDRGSLKLKYSAAALDDATKAGRVDVLQWWADSGLELKFNRFVLDDASASGHVAALRWWTTAAAAAAATSPCCDARRAQRERKSGSPLPPARAAAGHVDVLDWWRTESGLPVRYSACAVDGACENGHVRVLQWWRDSGLEIKFSPKKVAAMIAKDPLGPVAEWWRTSGIDVKGLGAVLSNARGGEGDPPVRLPAAEYAGWDCGGGGDRGVDWQQLYFCYESPSARRIGGILRFLAERAFLGAAADVLGICFREQIGKIQNGHLSWSIWIALGLYLLFGVSVAIQHRMFVYAAPQDFVYIRTYGIVPDPTEQKTSISLIVYVIATDTIFFVASQAQIIAVMGTCFMVVPPSIMLTVLLTDCDRVRKLVAEMQGTSTYKSSNISTGIKSTASKVV
ncbi:hypothetical protein DFJ73DRAFT_774650 [Zopfochytrium polystomum]|nr:hypothetical protein DFJ73DRAFT_774650 [Zopfochytrium polystomum]